MIETMVKEMIEVNAGNPKDIAHFLKVWAWCRTIGKLEGLDEHTQKVLEMSAVVHDISRPLCKIKYGNTNGKYQELESPAILEEFLGKYDISREDKDRIIYIVAHHHTYTDVEGIDLQILLEADFLVNSDEKDMDIEAIRTFEKNVFKTKSGKAILAGMYY